MHFTVQFYQNISPKQKEKSTPVPKQTPILIPQYQFQITIFQTVNHLEAQRQL